jgi:Amt family ammonium transporter
MKKCVQTDVQQSASLLSSHYVRSALGACLLTGSSSALAESATLDHGDTAWLLAASALVLFMCLPGLAMFYGGFLHRKNVLSILAQCFAVACVASLIWLFIGFPLAFGPDTNCNQWLCAITKITSSDQLRGSLHGTVPAAAFLLFQMTFALIAPALSLGGFAERMRFSAVLVYAALWSIVVYAPVAHWVWGAGWLAQRGVIDFAGGLVVHVTAGVSALVAAFVIGDRERRRTVTPAHSVPLVAIGGGMLWVGWFGFNGGSAFAANDDAAMALLVTHIGACAGALAWLGAEWLRFRKPSVTGLITGAVAGLVAITPACGYVSLVAGVVIGALGSVLAFGALLTMRANMSVDDALDVSPVHGVAGIVGAILSGVFASKALGGTGLSFGYSIIQQIGVQTLGVVAVVCWTGLASFLLLKLTDRIVGLRVGTFEEIAGLDIAEFGESGYVE